MSELCWEVPGALPRVSGAVWSRLLNVMGEEAPLERRTRSLNQEEPRGRCTSLAAIT